MDSSQDGDEIFVVNKALLDYSKLFDGAEIVKPSSLATSEFHFLLLVGNKVKVVNGINEQILGELPFDLASESSSNGIIGLCSDASTGLFYAYDQNSIFQVSVNDEGRYKWKVYLDMKEYAAAIANCQYVLNRDQVYLAHISYVLSFEEIPLKFLSANERDTLRTLLLWKLDILSKEDKCQITMISPWTTEL